MKCYKCHIEMKQICSIQDNSVFEKLYRCLKCNDIRKEKSYSCQIIEITMIKNQKNQNKYMKNLDIILNFLDKTHIKYNLIPMLHRETMIY